MPERDEQAETFNQDQQEMFQNPDTSPGETRQPTPGAPDIPPHTQANAATVADDGAANEASSDLDRGEV
jgi:hypothetical protein